MAYNRPKVMDAMDYVYTVDYFINEIVKNDPMSWINYCELIILPSGLVALARPSHDETLIHYAMYMEDKSYEEIKQFLSDNMLLTSFYIGKYGCVSVWYNHIVTRPKGMNTFVKSTLDKLISNNLVSENHSLATTCDYDNYLYRKEVLKSNV